MNKSYRLIWNETTQSWVAVAETAKGRGKRASAVVILAALGVVAQTQATLAAPPNPNLSSNQGAPSQPAANQLPTGGNVVAGQASITQGNTANGGAVMTINQGSNKAAVDWNTFNVGSNAQVNFVQPSSSAVTLNRVLDPNASQIFGRISANGQVFLTNPNGVYFAPGASADVGSLLATTGTITNADFMAGKFTFSRNGANGTTGKVVNEGELKAAMGGYIALLAPEVRNQGVILAQLGTVALAAGDAYTLQMGPEGSLANIEVQASTLNTLVSNGGAVIAPGGLVILSARSAAELQGGVVNHSGSISATSLTAKGGRIVLEGDQISLTASSKLEANGATGGGTVLVGGDWQGSGNMHQARQVTMAQGAQIDASATASGAGGQVVLWSDVGKATGFTAVAGTISATGAGADGKGGQVETSGHDLHIADAATVATGRGGQWLLDPANVIISTGTDTNWANSGGTYSPTSGATTTTVNSTLLGTTLTGGTSVTITTTNTGTSGGQAGNITVSNSVTSTGSANLTLQGSGAITFSAPVAVGGDFSATGKNIIVNANLNAGGNLLLNADSGAQQSYNGSGVLITPTATSGNVAVTTTSGNIVIQGRGGNNAVGAQQGVEVSGTSNGTATVQAGGSGTVSITGVGGASSATNIDKAQ